MVARLDHYNIDSTVAGPVMRRGYEHVDVGVQLGGLFAFCPVCSASPDTSAVRSVISLAAAAVSARAGNIRRCSSLLLHRRASSPKQMPPRDRSSRSITAATSAAQLG
jgi:hypothetical protein